MSQTDAKSFLERVAADEEFRRNLINELGSADASPQKLVGVGSRSGLAFTEGELAEALAARQKSRENWAMPSSRRCQEGPT
jgi:hypothetical protein